MIARRTTSTRALQFRKVGTRKYSRKTTVVVQAFFARKAPAVSSASSAEAAAELISVGKRFGGPSQAGNDAVADVVKSLGRVPNNPKAADLFGTWNIVYASGVSGLTALDGQIAKFTVGKDGTYENECTTRTFGVFGGYAKEGGKLKVTGGNRYDLIQEFTETKSGPGGVLLEEVEQPTVRSFEVLFLDSTTLAIRLSSTQFIDEDSSRPVTVRPDVDYFMLWLKAGARAPAAPARGSDEDEGEEEEEEEESGGLFGIFGTAKVGRKQPSLATIAERSAGDSGTAVSSVGNRQAELQAARIEARVKRETAALEQRERKREQQEERKRAATARRQQGRGATASDDSEEEGTAIVKGLGGLKGLFGGSGTSVVSRAAPPPAQEEEEGTAVVKAFGGLKGLFGGSSDEDTSVVSRKAPPAAAKRDAPVKKATPPKSAAARKAEAEAARAARAREAEERKRAQEEERARRTAAAAAAKEARAAEAAAAREAKAKEAEERKAAAEAKKQAEAAAKEEALARKAKIQEVLGEMQGDVRDSSATVKELQTLLRNAERQSKDVAKVASSATRSLETAEARFETAQAELDEMNTLFNAIAQQYRDKQAEVNSVEREVDNLEQQLLRR